MVLMNFRYIDGFDELSFIFNDFLALLVPETLDILIQVGRNAEIH